MHQLRATDDRVHRAGLDAFGAADAVGLHHDRDPCGLVLAATAVFRRLGHPAGVASALGLLARVALDRGDEHRAVTAYHEMLRLWSVVDTRYASDAGFVGSSQPPIFPRWTSVDDRRSVVVALAGLAAIAVAHGQAQRAATLVGAVDLRIDETGVAIGESVRLMHDRVAAAVRAVADGQDLISLDETARDELLEHYGQARLDPGAASLTEREKEILQLLAVGVSATDELADRLYISQKTVKNHLASIFQKLAVSDRTQAVTLSAKRGIIDL